MPSSRLYEMLAEAEARPSGALQDLQAATGAGTDILNSYKSAKEAQFGRQKLGDIFGPSSDISKRFPNLRLMDLQRKGLPELLKADLEDSPQSVIIPATDPNTGLPTGGTLNLGTFSKGTKVIPAPNVNIFRSQELDLAKQKAQDDATMNDIKSLESRRDAAGKRLAEITQGGITISRNQAEADALKNSIAGWNQDIATKSSTLHSQATPKPAAAPAAAAPSYTAPADLSPVNMRVPQPSLFRARPLDQTTPAISTGAAGIVPTPRPVVSRPPAAIPSAKPSWDSLPDQGKLIRTSDNTRWFFDKLDSRWKNYDTGEPAPQQ